MTKSKTLTALLALLIMALPMFAQSENAQRNNRLYIDDFSVAAGKTARVPIKLDNTDAISGIQFDIQFPEGVTAGNNAVALNDRTAGFAATCRKVGSLYRVLLYSTERATVLGNGGIVLYIDAAIPSTMGADESYDVELKDVTLAASNGENVCTAFSGAKMSVTKAPDLEVKNVSAGKTSLNPGDKLDVNWTVANIGDQTTGGGWKEQVMLVSGTTTKVIATTYYDQLLGGGGIVSRSVEATIPDIPGMDGDCDIQVKITPNADCGEPATFTANNTASANSKVKLGKFMILSFPGKEIEENCKTPIRIEVTRTGFTNATSSVSVYTKEDDKRVSMPSSIEIPKGQSKTYFYMNMVPNGKLDDNEYATFVASIEGYDTVSSVIYISDDTLPELMLIPLEEYVTEGGTIKLQIETERAPKDDLEINVMCDKIGRFDFPNKVILPSGEKSMTIEIISIDDEIARATEEPEFIVSANGYESAQAYITLLDNDIPAISLELDRNTVNENDGPAAITAKIRRLSHSDSKITVLITDDSNKALTYLKSSIVLESGVDEISFNIGVVDNDKVDGNRIANISAAVFLQSCSCTATSETTGSVTCALTILDDDGPALSIGSGQTSINEGASLQIIVKRNTNIDQSLTFAVECNGDGLEYQSTGVIPSGQAQIEFPVKAKVNNFGDDTKVYTLLFSADGHASTSVSITVTDETLPDASLESFEIQSDNFKVNANAEARIKISNRGLCDLPAGKVSIYYENEELAVADIYFHNPLAPGESTVISKVIKFPTRTGEIQVNAIYNETHGISELSYNNNIVSTTVNLHSPFEVIVTTDKQIYNIGEPIYIQASVGPDFANSEVEVYYINNGARTSVNVMTDENGLAQYTLIPTGRQSGVYSIGACYPGENSNLSMADINVQGIYRESADYIRHESVVGETASLTIPFINPSSIDATNIKIVGDNVPKNFEVSILPLDAIPANSVADLKIEIRAIEPSEGNLWQQIRFNVSQEGGATSDFTVYAFARIANGRLNASVDRIETTMTKGQTREYPFTIYNDGEGATGAISLSLPNVEWMRSATPITIPSLSSGESTTIVLSLTPTSSQQLNVPITGSIALNCENASGIAIPFLVEPVSAATGTLKVDVTDEYSYYAEGHPHLAGATVTVKHPVTGAIVAQGRTNNDGIYTTTLSEGYYKVMVSEDHHSSVEQNIVNVDAGREKQIKVFLPYDAVKVSYSIVETEIEDEYRIVTTVEFETNVPKPVVVISGPDEIVGNDMQPGDSKIVYFNITNHGLVTALNNTITLPQDDSEWSFQPLVELSVFDLAANQSAVIPLRITRKAVPSSVNGRRNATSPIGACMAGMTDWYQSNCGTVLASNEAAYNMALKTCAMGAMMEALGSAFSGGGSGVSGPLGPSGPGQPTPNKDFGPNNNVDVTNPVISESKPLICDPALASCAQDFLNWAFSNVPGIGPYLNQMNHAMDYAIDRDIQHLVDAVRDLLPSDNGDDDELELPFDEDGIRRMIECYERFNEVRNPRNAKGKAYAGSKYSWMDEFEDAANEYIQFMNLRYELFNILFGDAVWADIRGQKIHNLFGKIMESMSILKPIDSSELERFRPNAISPAKFNLMVARLNATVFEPESESAIDVDRLTEVASKILAVEKAAISEEYSGCDDKFHAAIKSYEEHINSDSQSMCASISLQFTNEMRMTRQAFRGTLIVENTNKDALRDVTLQLSVTDKNGAQTTSEKIQIELETLSGFDGKKLLGAEWTLDMNGKGVATVLYIPSKKAAPEEPTQYNFGGSLRYFDPLSESYVTRELAPIQLTVNPSPDVDLHYFMQRDIYGDNALTADVIEPSVDAEFSLLVVNKGAGDVKNMTIATSQPEIVDNEKGLLINVEIISSQLNGNDKSLALGQNILTDFGDIPAGETSYAQWWLRSSLLGHFSKYDVEATHLTSHGNPELSLLDKVEIHELIHGFNVNCKERLLRAFLVNDLADSEDTPDIIYFTDGTSMPVDIISSSTISQLSENEYIFIVNGLSRGWCYGSIADPTNGLQKLASISRQNGPTDMTDNIWQTGYTLRDGKDPLKENLLHFVDDFSGTGTVTYLLTFEPQPDVVLEVESFEGVPEEGEIADKPVEQVKVVFNKAVDASSFTTDDVSLTIQGVKQDAGMIGIAAVDEKSFVLDFSKLNEAAENGYYVLTVQTAGISDAEGFNGQSGKSIGWNMYRDGMLQINASVYPEEAGTVSGNRNVEYGSTASLTAAPNQGYQFAYWEVEGVEGSREEEWNATALSDMNVVAHFILNTYNVTIDPEIEGGAIEGAGTGIYSYGQELELNAVADTDYEFSCWIVNGKEIANGPELTVTISDQTEISAMFNYIGKYYLPVNIAYGWTWMSHNLSTSASVDEVMDSSNIYRILSQTKEAIRDPELGVVGTLTELIPQECYKVESRRTESIEFSGYERFNAATTIPVNTGWNWLGYPLADRMPVDEAFAPTAVEELDVIVGQNGFAQFDGTNWVGTLEVMTPGLGYMYQSRSAKDIVYNTAPTAKASARYSAAVSAYSPLTVDIYKYPAVMPVVATLTDMEGILLDNKDYQVNAFCGSECRGIGRVVNGLVMMNVYGNSGDAIDFRVTDASCSSEFAADASVKFCEEVVGSIVEPYSIAVNTMSGISDVTYDGNITVSIVNDVLFVKGIAPEMVSLVDVYDVDGRRLVHETNLTVAGIDVSHLSAGAYIVIVLGNGEYTYHKIALR